MDEAVRKERLYYQQFKSIGKGSKIWQNKESTKATMGVKRQNQDTLRTLAGIINGKSSTS